MIYHAASHGTNFDAHDFSDTKHSLYVCIVPLFYFLVSVHLFMNLRKDGRGNSCSNREAELQRCSHNKSRLEREREGGVRRWQYIIAHVQRKILQPMDYVKTPS